MGRRLSEEHKEKLRLGRERAKRLRELESDPEVKKLADELVQPSVKPEQVAQDQTVAELKREIDELKAMFSKGAQPAQQSPQFGNQGQIIGTYEKYVVDPSNYPNPTDRLMKEPKLAPFAFDYNYEIDYQIHVSQYETKDGRNVKEPRFMIELRRVVLDDAGVPTDKRYIVRKLTFHEDPQAAIVVARDNGLEVDESNEAAFLNEMRYIRVRDWLMGIFYPAPSQPSKSKNEVVVDNQVVEMITINSENSEAIPFNQLGNKLRT